jgi:alkylation response protein AidB-like acyl-CoA dehydrogenase
MDFTPDEEEAAVLELAERVLTEMVTPARLAELEAAEEPYDRALWATLADTGLLGIGVPAEHGGSGVGLVGLGGLLEVAGRTAAPVPVLATLGYGVLPLARFGTPAQQAAWLPGVAGGKVVLTAALVEDLGEPLQPATTARRDGDGWVLDGTKICVPAGTVADAALVSATTPDGAGLFLIEPGAGEQTGLRVTPTVTIAGTPQARYELAGVRVGPQALVGPPDSSALAWTLARVTAATCAVMAGVTDAAVRLTADHTRTRHQFGHPLADFQAVRQRIADSFVDTRAIRFTMLEALWRLDAGLPAQREVAVAKLVAAEGGRRVVRAATHLHGGTGVDRTYPLHRYYLHAKQLELTLGGASRQLRALGRLLAEPEPEPELAAAGGAGPA